MSAHSMTGRKMWIAYQGLVIKECIRWLRIWPQSLLPSAITIVLYFMIFGRVIGPRIGSMSGVPYLEFITPGLIMMAVITNTFSNVVSSFYGVRFSRAVEEFLASPMPNCLIILGYVTGGVLRGLVVALIVSLLGMFFSGVHILHGFLALITCILCATLFSLAGFLNGLFARKFDDTVILTTFILTPLIYLGGVFYSIQNLPPFWQKVSAFNPVAYIIDLFRYAYLGIGTPSHIAWIFALVIGCVIALFMLTWILLVKGVRVKS